MTPEEIAEIKADLDAITPRPWHAYFTSHGDPYVTLAPPSVAAFNQIAQIDTATEDYGKTNCEFIAKAPERIATLVSEVEKLRKVVDFYDGKNDGQAWAKVAGLEWNAETEREFERLQDVEQEYYKLVEGLVVLREKHAHLKVSQHGV